ncbi:major facilitator superfamily domain-containing protein [Penicillium sp. DV-2018c]|nr:major facilitator superfamily domain-containing protein [Penicillium sp. DV-2018c]KAJ5582185.1 major facilitator superfamily domain-containing protein [Penicillium sp. DV-2018c]
MRPRKPFNFTPARKWFITSLLSAIGFMTPFASSIIAPAISSIETEFGEDDITKAAMPVSIFLLGYAVGPLFLSPLSEIYGRHVVMVTSSAFFCVWLVGCALAPSLDALIAFRLLSGIGGSASQTVGGATIADIFPIQEGGRAMAIWMLGPILGPSLAPVIGGFVTEKIGWRWLNWITLIPTTLVVIAMILFNCETNHHVLIRHKTNKMRRELGRPELHSCYIGPEAPILSKQDILVRGLVRPLRLLFGSAIVFGVSLYIAFAYGCLYLFFNTIPIVFEGSYGWSTGITGIVYLALLVGYIIGLLVFFTCSDKTVIHMTNMNGGIYEPEMRLPICIYLSPLLPIAFFWYGWSSEKGISWVVPVLGLVIFGIGFECIWLPTQAHIVDAYSQHAASALAALSVMRSVVAAFLPLAGPRMYQKLGIGWGNSLLGFIALALVPVPILIYRLGGRIRRHKE